MSFSEAFSSVMKIRRAVVIVSIVAGAGYKVAPMIWHKADAKPARPALASVNASPSVSDHINPMAPKSSGQDLGEIALTNHYETCVSLGGGKNCILSPKMLDKENVQLTLTVESKTAAGKTHDMTITQVVTRAGKPVEVAVGDFNFSLTPSVTSE
jgi:orotate phosphoribosyltransferase-like protein